MISAVLSNFGLAAWLALAVVAATAASAVIAAMRTRAAGRPVVPATARVMSIGSALLIIAATAAPYSWPPERYGFGDLVLEIGRAGLGDIDQAIAEPTSLAALLLFANVALYVPLTASALIGWPERGVSILVTALGLSLGIEAVQYVALERVAATDDVALNMSGALIGWFTGLLLRRHLRAPARVVSAVGP